MKNIVGKVIAAVVIIILVILGCCTFNYFSRGVWALPFVRNQIATVKATDRNTGEEKYYAIYSNGERAVVDASSRDKNAVSYAEAVAVAEDFANQTRDLRLIAPRYFRDDQTIYIAGLRDTGFGGSNYKVYAYNISRRKLRYLVSLETDDEADWIYSE